MFDKKALSVDELESQVVLELPARELLGALIHVHGISVDLDLLNVLVRNSFNNYRINVLSGNDVDIDVGDVLSDNDIAVFCNQVIAVLAAQCFTTKRW